MCLSRWSFSRKSTVGENAMGKIRISLFTACCMFSLLFSAAKIVGWVTWSWWIVFLPVYLIPGIILLGLLVVGTLVGVMGICLEALEELGQRRVGKKG